MLKYQEKSYGITLLMYTLYNIRPHVLQLCATSHICITRPRVHNITKVTLYLVSVNEKLVVIDCLNVEQVRLTWTSDRRKGLHISA